MSPMEPSLARTAEDLALEHDLLLRRVSHDGRIAPAEQATVRRSIGRLRLCLRELHRGQRKAVSYLRRNAVAPQIDRELGPVPEGAGLAEEWDTSDVFAG